MSELSYEEARDQLVEVVRTLEQGGTSLAESLALWERGEELAKVCRAALDGARARLDEAARRRREGLAGLDRGQRRAELRRGTCRVRVSGYGDGRAVDRQPPGPST